MAIYATDLLTVMVDLLKKGITNKDEKLTFKILEIIMTVADIIDSDFAVHYGNFIPMMAEILGNVDSSNMGNKKLRAKAIDTIGSIFSAISECE
jgi:hypothetical protein